VIYAFLPPFPLQFIPAGDGGRGKTMTFTLTTHRALRRNCFWEKLGELKYIFWEWKNVQKDGWEMTRIMREKNVWEMGGNGQFFQTFFKPFWPFRFIFMRQFAIF
jgi:hypothetical protein